MRKDIGLLGMVLRHVAGRAIGRGVLIALALALSAPGAALGSSGRDTGSAAAGPAEAQARDAYGKLPLTFVPNAGQVDRRVRFAAQAGGASVYFTQREAVYAFVKKDKSLALRLGFPGADPKVRVSGERPARGKVNYFVGSDPTRWHTNVPTYGEVVYHDLWPGIDLVFRGEEGRLEYELHVAPGASVRQIRLDYLGVESLSLDPQGNLLLDTVLGTLSDARPVSYQEVGGRRVPVESRFVLGSAAGAYGFAVGEYDRRLPLVIDPCLVYSTYLGGTADDEGLRIAVDDKGEAYVTGIAASADFPTTAGAFETSYNGGTFDAFVTKLNAAGTALVYSTYLGGSSEEYGNAALAVDGAGSVYVTGWTQSTDFPTTAGAFDTSYNGGGNDVFVTKLNATGSALDYSTYLGGTGYDTENGIAVDDAGSAYVTGWIQSSDFPTTAGAFDTSYGGGSWDGYATKLNASGSALVYSTYLGGSFGDYANAIAVDGDGSAYVSGGTDSPDFPTTGGAFDTSHNGGGDDVFVTKLNADGSALVYSTFVGGSSDERGLLGIAVDGAGGAYVAGRTRSADFPTTPGAFDTSLNDPEYGSYDSFVMKLNASGSELLYSTYLGGTADDLAYGLAIDGAGNAYAVGFTLSGDFPTTPCACDTSHNGGVWDAFVTKLNASGSALLYSTYLGGSSFDYGFGIAVDGAGSAYVVGRTSSPNFPTTAGAFDTSANGGSDAFVTKLDPASPVCDDGLYCNGVETCDSGGSCVPGTPPCDDHVTCTLDICDEQTDSCAHTPGDAACDDGSYCNGVETCDLTAGCLPGTSLCDDHIACTMDFCDEQDDSCTNTPNDAVCDDGLYCNGMETCGSCNGLSFAPRVLYPYAQGTHPVAVATGDFNNDGLLDAIIPNQGTATASLLTNDPDSPGQFISTTIQPFGSNPADVVAGDFNTDGDLDFAVTSFIGSDVRIALGDGHGNFAVSAGIHLEVYIGPVAAGHFHSAQDGRLDLVVATNNSNAANRPIYVLGNDGAGVFTVRGSATPGASGMSALVAADFDHDGIDDVAVTDDVGERLAILRGDGNYGFVSPVFYDVGFSRGVAVGDFDGDGEYDLVVALSHASSLLILRGHGDGTFTEIGSHTITQSVPGPVTVADFDCDGHQDIVMTGPYTNVTVLMGDGLGGFPVTATFDTGTYGSSIAAGDFNKDHSPDLVVPGYFSDDKVSILLNDCSQCATDGSVGCAPGTPPCDDHIGCTIDSCDEQSDSCGHTSNDAVCGDGEPCTDDLCNPAAGCVHPNNTASCDDDNTCTYADTCAGGTCAGTPVPAPSEASGVSVDKSGTDAIVAWTLATGATTSDVLRGEIAALPVGPAGGDEVCLGNTGATTMTDPYVPAVDSGVWYLIRGANACAGNGPYGFQGEHGAPGAPRLSTTCP